MINTTIIAGPCVIESAELLDTVARKLVEINTKLGTDIIFQGLVRQSEPHLDPLFQGAWHRQGVADAERHQVDLRPAHTDRYP